MISANIALAVYVLIAAFIMIDRNNARGFSIAVFLGLLTLPQATDLELPGLLPDLGKTEAIGLGIFLGTVVFHVDALLRFRPRPSDALLVLLLIGAAVTSHTNELGIYDGLSAALSVVLDFVLLVFLARVHLSGPRALRTFLITLVWASVLYAPLALWEWRMSPQIHTTLYGYFQHRFIQFGRGGFYRPVVCFAHALRLARFFALAAFLAAFPLRRELARSGPLGNLVFLVPLGGLLLSMSPGPYLLFMSFCGLYWGFMNYRRLLYLVPGLGIVYIALVLLGHNPLYGAVDIVAMVSQDRAQSLQYRLDALQEYREPMLEQPWFGQGGWGRGRTRRATDSTYLVETLRFGLVGSSLLFGWWLWTMHIGLRLSNRTRGTGFSPIAWAISVVTALCILASFIDNALASHVLLIACGLVGVDGMMRASNWQGPSAQPVGARTETPWPSEASELEIQR